MGAVDYGASLQNEVKGWPALLQIGAGIDLVTLNQWWDDEGTPTTKASAVPVSGEASLDAKFLQVIKCITDAVDEGFKQTYTYADEPRIKSGTHLSALVWVATTSGGTGITVKLRNSGGSSTTATSVATDGDWSLLCVEDHTCSGTSVDLVVTKNTTGTFYAGGPITVMVGADAIGLTPRHLIYRSVAQATVKTLTGLGDEDTWTDVDVTATTSNLAAMAQLNAFFLDSTSGDVFALHTRYNGSAEAEGADTVKGKTQVTAQIAANAFNIVLDDAQIFEYNFDREGGSGTLEFGVITILGYWEWE